MSSLRRMNLGPAMAGICSKMNRTKRLDGNEMETPLRRCLTTFDMTLLGVGHMVGAGIYVLTGNVAHSTAGPGIIISIILAGLLSFLAALCYAEFGSRIPRAGSAYVYTYVSIGEFWAFMIGWNMIMEHIIGAASVARAWSAYVNSLSNGAFAFSGKLTKITIVNADGTEESVQNREIHFDPLAAALCLLYAFLLAGGVKISTRFNSALTLINIAVILFIMGMGIQYVNLDNWTDEKHGGFLPFGLPGVFAGTATCLYAFIGFDSIASSSEEAKNPSRSIPLSLGLSVGIVMICYISLSAMLTLVVPYWKIDPDVALPNIFSAHNIQWAKYVITVGALCGMTTTLFGSLFSLPRIMYSMASDGLLMPQFVRVNSRIQLPVFNFFISAIMCSIMAFFFQLHDLIEFMSIGTFLAYTIVAASVIILRYRPESQLTSILPTNVRKNNDVLSPNSDISSGTTSVADSSSPDDSEGYTSEQIDRTGMLKPKYEYGLSWLKHWEPGTAVSVAVVIFIISRVFDSTSFPIILTIIGGPKYDWILSVVATILGLIMIVCLVVIGAHEQCPAGNKFRVPWVPVIPALSIYFNIGLLGSFHPVTFYRFFIWLFLGILVYFLYGMHHSKEATGTNSYSVLMTQMEVEQAQAQNKIGHSTIEPRTKCTAEARPRIYQIIRPNIKTNTDKTPILNPELSQ